MHLIASSDLFRPPTIIDHSQPPTSIAEAASRLHHNCWYNPKIRARCNRRAVSRNTLALLSECARAVDEYFEARYEWKNGRFVPKQV